MEAGFSNVFALAGGLQRWTRQGRPLGPKGAGSEPPAPPQA